MDAFAAAPVATSTQPAGQLFVVQCEPDPFTRERLNVGVFAVDASGRRKARMIDQAGRLECLYGSAAGNVVLLAKAAGEAALACVQPPSPQLRFDGPKPYFNCSLDEAVDRAFAELVTVALPQRDAPQASKLTDELATEAVTSQIKLLLGLNMDLLANTPQVVLNTDRGPWTVSMPLQPLHGVGTIRSADYTPATLKTHLMDSMLDLECAARYRHKRSAGLFLLRPQGLDRKGQAAVDDVVDSVLHRAQRNLHFDQADTASHLARLIREWGDAQTAG
ncbi:hypothetical protein [Acidovorax sp.]|uniref:hypothetical protein n=1 Tax=Acidovorax sp. TaxID=1872122 RepID=UPI00258C761A|nr:hypothetical protein [Acidovorax sp.]